MKEKIETRVCDEREQGEAKVMAIGEKTKTTEGDKGKKVRDLWVERESKYPLKRDEGKNRDKSL